MNYYLAVDLGASGGRHILGHAEGGELVLEELYRFPNAPLERETSLVWDTERLYGEIVLGIKKCGSLGKIPCSAGIDTWGVDYALIGKDDRLIEPVYSYRDARTGPFVDTALPFEEHYALSGTAFQPFNTVYQLLADKAAGRLENAERFLSLPGYFSRRLAGNPAGQDYSEYTSASTTGLLDVRRRVWAGELIEKLGLPAGIFRPVRLPPWDAGELEPSLGKEAGFTARIVTVAGHDTASAVAALESGALYISSGTWSLLGITGDPILSEEARLAGYTNEGAHDGRIRFLKNIMGLWVIQRLRHELGGAYSFTELEEMARGARRAAGIRDWRVDLNLPRFLNPPSMIAALRDECARGGRRIPQSPGELAFCAYSSLAGCYKTAIEDLERITGKTYPSISIIGGGSKDRYLNTLSAEYTGKTVFAGPAEAAAAGNVLLQMKQAGDEAVREGFSELIKNSFDIEKYP
jgi:rhamnulokinase